MTDEHEKLKFVTKLGPKSQIVLGKDIREAVGIKPGSLLKESVVKKKIILEPFDWDAEIRDVERIARIVGKRWPKGKTSIDLIREERG